MYPITMTSIILRLNDHLYRGGKEGEYRRHIFLQIKRYKNGYKRFESLKTVTLPNFTILPQNKIKRQETSDQSNLQN